MIFEHQPRENPPLINHTDYFLNMPLYVNLFIN